MDNNTIYVGIDVSKEKNDICVKNSDGNILKRFQIQNTKIEFKKLYQTVDNLKDDAGTVIFGMEATGIYYFPLYSALKRAGYLVNLFNPIQTHGYRQMEIRKTKTDTIDAAIIVDMLRIHEPPIISAIDNMKLYQLRELCRIRHRIVKKRTKCKTQLIRNLDMVWPGYKKTIPTVFAKTSIAILKKYSVPSKVTAQTFEEFYENIKKVPRTRMTRKKLEEVYDNASNVLTMPELDSIARIEINSLLTEIELYDKQAKSIEKKINQIMNQIDSKINTIPGLGNVLGSVVFAEIGDISRFSSAKKLVAFAGLDPIVSQSGKFENITGPISKRGSADLRYALFNAANIARKTDEKLKRFYNKKIEEGKHHFSALNATAAKILRIVFWVLKNNKDYRVQLA